MPLVFACVAPHMGVVLPEFADEPDTAAPTRAAMQTMGERLRDLAPETLVVITPHGVTIRGAVSLAGTERAAGHLEGRAPVDLPIDQELSGRLAAGAMRRGLPLLRCWYGDGVWPLDWGALIPLRLLAAGVRPPPRLAVLCPSSQVPRAQLLALGELIARAAEESPRRVALIASADQGHGHRHDGPYGFDPASARFDALMQQALAGERLEQELVALDDGFVEAAKIDSLWPTLMLAGALRVVPMRPRLHSYQVLAYCGVITAEFTRGG